MNLDDGHLLELNALCAALVDGTLNDAEHDRLQALLHESGAARRFYVRYMDQSAGLSFLAAEMQSEAFDGSVREPWRPRFGIAPLAVGAAAGIAAAAVAAVLWVGEGPAPPPAETTAAEHAMSGELDTEHFVARLTGTSNCVWSATTTAPREGDDLPGGGSLELKSGAAEFTFDCGACVTLEGPAAIVLNSPWEATLLYGALHAFVPAEAVGFRIHNAAVEVVDLGTEFSMVAEAGGAADVYVIKGKVQAAARDAGGQTGEAVILEAREARRFERARTAEVRASRAALKRASGLTTTRHALAPPGYVHWAFDTDRGGVLPAEVVRLDGVVGCDALTDGKRNVDGHSLLEDGYRGQSLRLNGEYPLSARVGGLAEWAPRTVAFWVNVPVTAPLSDAPPILAWLARTASDGDVLLPVRIGWNANPGQGALGAPRTEYGAGHIVGTRSLRDGCWHHLAVVFVPHDTVSGKLHVKLYVDGHLESVTSKRLHPSRKAAPPAPGSAIGKSSPGPDVLLIGRAPGGVRRSHRRFLGGLDELFIANRALTPQEIKRLMKDNSLESDVRQQDGREEREAGGIRDSGTREGTPTEFSS